MNSRKVAIILAVAFGVLVIVAIVYALIPRATITFAVAPEEVQVEVNGKNHTVQNGQSITVAPGDITVIVSRNEFDSYTEKFTVKNGETYEVLAALAAKTLAAERLLQTPGSQAVIQRVEGRKVERGAAELVSKNPLLKELPIIDKFYKIIVCNSQAYPDDTSKFAICVQLYELEARDAALNDIRSRGYNPEDYEIIVQDLTYETLRENAGE
jgi:hypothetical protein